jgi:formylglycine-generating enzyme required for sulfatase activity
MKRDSDGMLMALVPAGKFTMGSDTGEAEEGPSHEVYLDDFWIDTTEITNQMYSLCVEASACKPPLQTGSYTRKNYHGDSRFLDYPVVNVDWDMANAYCQWVGARLPTEAQWEKSARGTDGRIFTWGNNWDVQKFKRLNFADKNSPELTSDLSVNDGYGDTSPAGHYTAGISPYGIYDLAGNVWEWVADWYDASYYASSPSENPKGPAGPTPGITSHVLRGGSWVSANEVVFHTYNRNDGKANEFSESIGFRCAK